MGQSPAITFMMEFTKPHKTYVDYTNKKEKVSLENEWMVEQEQQQTEDISMELLEAIHQEVPEQQLDFREYIDYMNRTYATKEKVTDDVTPLFNQTFNQAPKSVITDLKKKLELANENGSLLWKGVLSFDTHFLAKQGILDKETNKVDQRFIKEAVREAMPALLKKEGLENSAFWWGDIHLNTENVHVHIGISEIESTRELFYYAPRRQFERKGQFSKQSFKTVKSHVFHHLLNEKDRDRMIRKEQIIANVKTDLVRNVIQKKGGPLKNEVFFLEQAYTHLPVNKKWRYGSNAKEFAISKFYLNRYLDSYLQNSGQRDYQEFRKETVDFLMTYQTAYTAEEVNQTYEKIRHVEGKEVKRIAKTKGFDVEEFLTKRELDLRERLGNRILEHMREELSSHVEEEMNIVHFSEKNQESILNQRPTATMIRTAESWKAQGYRVKENEQSILVAVPIFELDENGEPTEQLLGFEKQPYYDRSQTEVDPSNRKRPSVDGLVALSSEELMELIALVKEQSSEAPPSKGDLGIYKYALRLKGLEEQRAVLLNEKETLMDIQPLATDAAFIQFKLAEIGERMTLNGALTTSNWTLTSAEKSKRNHLKEKYEDVVRLPIKRATNQLVSKQVERLEQEFQLASQVKDFSIFTLLKGEEATRARYLGDIVARIDILKAKQHIHQNNEQIATLTDEAKIHELKKENGQAFNFLKKAYTQLLGVDDRLYEAEKMLSQIQTHSTSLEEFHRNMKKTNSQRLSEMPYSTHRVRHVTTSFMQGLSSALKGNKNKAAFQRKAREAEQEEREEKRKEHSR